jgi:two-component system, OmpR family, osmolarity sensor histidine kinase EnvZ
MTVTARAAPTRGRTLYSHFNRFLERYLPAGLYQRSLIIVIAPIVLMQAIMVGMILDRHWDNVTQVLAKSLAREIGFVIDLYDHSPKTPEAVAQIETTANKKMRLGLTIQRDAKLPAPIDPPLFSMVDSKLAKYLTRDVGKNFWIDSSGQKGHVDIRVEVEPGTVFRILTEEERAYAANTNGLLSWMVISSVVLLIIAVLFLHNQIQPILDLARAARSFGMGHDVGTFKPRGAAEVRQAAQAFLNMKDRIEKHVEQRTAMLAGVSHDLRTILTRFKLELALLRDSAKVRALKEDVEEMQQMLEAYMAFVKGDGGEKAETTDIGVSLSAAANTAMRGGGKARMDMPGGLIAKVKPNAFRRLATNLISNAARFGQQVAVAARSDGNHLIVTVDDDGPGIPHAMREDVFRPFVRLDAARNQDESGTGLGLSIARDIARAHGGDITLEDSPLGGLRAVVAIPV